MLGAGYEIGYRPYAKMANIIFNILFFTLKLALLISFLSSNMKECFTLNEAGKTDLNADRRTIKCQPFLHKVLGSSNWS